MWLQSVGLTIAVRLSEFEGEFDRAVKRILIRGVSGADAASLPSSQ